MHAPDGAPVAEAPDGRHAEEMEADDDSSDWGDLDTAGSSAPGAGTPPPADDDDALPAEDRASARLAWLASRLSYGLVSAPGVWERLQLTACASDALAAALARSDAAGEPVQTRLVQLLCERWARLPPWPP